MHRLGVRHVAGHIGELHQPLGLAQAGIEVDAGGVDRGARVHGRQLADHGIRGVDARLGLGGARLRAASEPLDLSPYAVAQALLLAALRLQISLFLLKKAAEVALYAQQAAGKDAIQLDDLSAGAFKEVAIVADRDSGERGVSHQRLKPLDSGQIQVVGGLVQQHHLRLANHSFCDGQPLAPSAAERGRLRVEIGKAGAARKFAQTALAGIRFIRGLVYVGGGQRGLQDLADRKAGSKTRVLGHVGGAGALAHRQLAGVGFDLPGQNGKQRGLARAIGADQADAVSFLHGQRDIAEEWRSAELLGHGLRVEDWRHCTQIFALRHRSRIAALSPPESSSAEANRASAGKHR